MLYFFPSVLYYRHYSVCLLISFSFVFSSLFQFGSPLTFSLIFLSFSKSFFFYLFHSFLLIYSSHFLPFITKPTSSSSIPSHLSLSIHSHSLPNPYPSLLFTTRLFPSLSPSQHIESTSEGSTGWNAHPRPTL